MLENKLLDTAKLCYVSGGAAYFTTQELDKQWGDDWNDVPYEHNARDPYTYGDWDKQQGKALWQIIHIYYEGPFDRPGEWELNSSFSVEQINNKETPWLEGSKFSNLEGKVQIWAGTSLQEFIRTVLECGGEIFMPLKLAQTFNLEAA